ncbi:type I polyketide synthase, partial [Micromonospora sp. NPDC004336]
AHGTGTTLGDPIEAQALLATYGQGRPADRPLWLGSVKSNIGHTQAAAGVAGVIKMVLAMRHGLVPATLHVDEPSPHIDWTAGAVTLATEPTPWPTVDRPRRAAVSSFGISGTNAHVVIEQAPEPAAATPPDTAAAPPAPSESAAAPPTLSATTPAVVPFALSAADPVALRGQAGRLRSHLAAHPELEPAEVAYALTASRVAFPYRAVVLGRDRDELARGLDALAAGHPAADVVTGTVLRDAAPVLVFSGYGAQWPGTAADLLDTSPVFAAAVAECEEALAPWVDWSLTDVLRAAPDAPQPVAPDVVRPALWAVMVSLARLWAALGVRPAGVVGHGPGEIAAACVAGALSLADGARVVALRGRALADSAPHAEAVDRAPHGGAADSAPHAEAVDRAPRGEAADSAPHAEAVDGAPHGEAAAGRLAAGLAGIAGRPAETPYWSASTGRPLDTAGLDADHWCRDPRETADLARVVRGLLDEGHQVFLEVGPHPVAGPAIRAAADAAGREAVVVDTLRRDAGGWPRLLTALATLHAHGVEVDWAAVHGPRTGPPVSLPTYAFHRQRYWPEAPALPGAVAAAGEPADRRFWDAVERADAGALAEAMRLDDTEARRLDDALPLLAAWRRRRRDESTVDVWRYRVTWTPVTAPTTAALGGRWLVPVPAAHADAPLTGAVLRALAEAGAEPVLLAVADPDRAALADLLRAAGPESAAGVCSLLALDDAPHREHPVVPAGLAGTLALTQALGDAGVAAPLWCVSSGAVSTGRADPVDRPGQALAWGLGRVAALEHPDRWGGLVDLPADPDQRARARLAAALAGNGHEDQLAVRPSGLFARRLVRAAAGDRPAGHGWRPGGTVLVTGGLGSIGAHVARWLARAGAAHLVLTSRQGPAAPGAAELEAELTGHGAAVTVAACDVADRESLRAFVDGLAEDGTRIDAVFHAAGVPHAGALADTDVAALAGALRAKVAGAANLDEVLGPDLTAFVLFSSGAGVWGGGHQGAYAAGNAFLDALAEDRRRRGLPGTALAWGAWDGGGMAAAEGAADQMFRSGVRPMDPDLAVAVLAGALERDEPALTVADVAWDRFLQTFALARPRPLIGDIPEVARALAAARPGDDDGGTREASPLRGRLAGLAAPERRRLLLDLVRVHAAAVLRLPSPQALAADRSFREIGFDSLSAVEMRNRLAEAVGLTLPATLVFDRPSPTALADHLVTLITGDDAEATPAVRAATALDEPIAVVSMSCRYPGGVADPEDLWRLVSEGRDGIAGFPADRGWDLDAIYDPDPDRPGTSYVREGGFLADAAGFDAALFGISPREAMVMDPQQRVLLESAWELFERAGTAPADMRETNTGVFVGTNGQDYATLLLAARVETEGYQATGNVAAVISGRLAYHFGLRGPAVSVDTACSSSLVALHLACQSLRQGECDSAVAGGVTVMATPGPFLEFARQRGLALDGRCKSFAAAADGTGWGEGVGLVMLQRLSDARREGRRILAVVRGSAMNQDGASNGLTAPNGPAQERVIRQALANARLTAADVDAVDGHGTGTRLGDPIEAQALLATYGRDRPADRPLLLGSIKSNIGHTQAAAGVSGVIKMVMALQHDLLPPTLHVDEPTPHVDWSAGAVALLTEPRPWPAVDRPRRAGVSSFGVSGTNVHVILEQAPVASPADTDAPRPAGADAPTASAEASTAGADAPTAGADAPTASADAPTAGTGRNPLGAADAPPVLPFVVSADSADGLPAQAARLADWLPGSAAPAADVARALATKRSPLRHRAVLLAADADAALAGLRALAAGQDHPGLTRGVAEPGGALAVLFSGQGAQHAGMGRQLYAAFPRFAAALDEACQHLDAHLPRPLREVLFAEPGTAEADLLDRTAFTQAGLFAVEVALFRLVEEWGIRPDLVAGHSVGEIVAAHVAGVLSLPDACTLVGHRGRLMQALPAGGGMLAVAAPEVDVRRALAGTPGQLDVAAVNGPAAVVVAGAQDALTGLADHFAGLGVRTKRLRVSHAFHSPLMEPVLADFAAVAATLSYAPPTVPLVSNLTGTVVDADTLCTPDYWVRHVREAVRFADTVTHLHAHGVTRFLEVGPDTVLTALTADALPADAPVVVTGVQRPGQDEVATLLGAVARLHCQGVPVRWSRLLPGGAGPVGLPTYAFAHQRFWPTLDAAATHPPAAGRDDTDAAFWQAVTSGDGDALADRLGVDPDRPLRDLLPELAQWRRQQREDTLAGGWRYRITWRPEALAAGAADGHWTVVHTDADRPVVDRLAELVTARGGTVRRIAVDPATVDRAALAERLAGDPATTDRAAPTRIVSLLALDERPHPDRPAVPLGLTANLALVQAVTDTLPPVPLWLLTRQAVSTAPDDPVARPGQATTWGLGLVTALEHPRHWGGLLDLPATLDDAAAEHVLAALTAAGDEDQLAVRPSGVYARRLCRAPAGPAEEWRPRGAVLVHGAAAARAPHLLRWLVERGATHLVLAGPAAPAGLAAAVTAVDDLDRLPEVLDRLATDGAEVRTVLHVADSDGAGEPVTALEPADLAAAVAARTAAVELLDRACGDRPVDEFVVFSSTAAVWGGGGAAVAAAAGEGLAALAARRRAAGRAATVVAWVPWADEAAEPEQLRRRGVRPLATDVALSALRLALAGGDDQIAVADLDWSAFVPAFTAVRPSPLLRGVPEAVAADLDARPAVEAGDPARVLRDRLTAASPADRHRILLDLVRARVATVLGHASPGAVEADHDFLELGFDSLTALELRDALRQETGAELSATLLFDHPTPTALARHLLDQTVGADAAEAAPDTAGEPAPEGAGGGLLGGLFNQPRAREDPAGYAELLVKLAQFRPSFSEPGQLTRPAGILRLARGGAGAPLVCCCTMSLLSGAHEYARLAAGFRGARDVWALPNPGFGAGEELPADLDALLRVHADTVRRAVGSGPFVLAGHSGGAMVANLLAGELERQGRPPAAVVLMDTYPADSEVLGRWVPQLLDGMIDRDSAYTPMDDWRTTAWAGYLPLFLDWQPAPMAASTLLVRASEPLGEWDGEEGGWRSRWPYPHEAVDAAGDHFSMVADRGPELAGTVQRWLTGRRL